MLLLPRPNYWREDHLETWLHWKYEPRTEEFLNQLARDVVGNKVFLSSMMNNTSLDDLSMVFMPLLFAEKRYIRFMEVCGAWLIYANYEDAFPRSVNGYPTFRSVAWLNKGDSDRLFDRIRRLQAAMNNALDPRDG